MSRALKIGELASQAGVSADTVRYYERLNLLPRPSRTRAGYRVYSDADAERLRFIRQAQTLGLSLDDIRLLMHEGEGGLAKCRRVRDLLSSRLEQLDQRIAEMRAFRSKLLAYLEECEEALAGKRGDSCPVLFEISHRTDGEASRPARAIVAPKKFSARGKKG